MTPQISLRHTLATLAYRVNSSIQNAPANFSECSAGGGTRSAGEILAHMGDLLDWAQSLVEGHEQWRDSAPLAWNAEIKRFFTALRNLDDLVASDAELHASAAQLFQGAVADALWHTGQLALLRRLAGAPIESENYAVAPISEGAILMTV